MKFIKILNTKNKGELISVQNLINVYKEGNTLQLIYLRRRDNLQLEFNSLKERDEAFEEISKTLSNMKFIKILNTKNKGELISLQNLINVYKEGNTSQLIYLKKYDNLQLEFNSSKECDEAFEEISETLLNMN